MAQPEWKMYKYIKTKNFDGHDGTRFSLVNAFASCGMLKVVLGKSRERLAHGCHYFTQI